MEDKSPDTAAGAATETPWEFAQRLAAQGFPLSTVNEQLLKAGLPAEDAATLVRALHLRSVAGPGEKRETDPNHGLNMLVGMAKVGLSARALLAGGELEGRQALDGMLQVTAGFMQVGLEEKPLAPGVAPPAGALPEVAPFEAEEGAPRCQVHPQALAVDTCPRCAARACFNCAPKKGSGGTELCAACEQQPAVHESRVKKAAGGVAVALFAEAVLLLALMFFAPLLGSGQSSGWGPVPVEAALGLFFAGLAVMQWLVRHPAPGLVGAVVAGGLLPASIIAAPEEVPTQTLVLLLVPMAVMLFTLDRLATRRKALLATRKP